MVVTGNDLEKRRALQEHLAREFEMINIFYTFTRNIYVDYQLIDTPIVKRYKIKC